MGTDGESMMKKEKKALTLAIVIAFVFMLASIEGIHHVREYLQERAIDDGRPKVCRTEHGHRKECPDE